MFEPLQCSEREPDGTYEDCTFASGVMLANAAEGRNIHPPTQAEYEALRRASGDLAGGAGLDELQDGMRSRYDWAPALGGHAWSSIVNSADVGTGLIIQGHLNALNAHYNRWNRTRVAHAMYFQRKDAKLRFWLKNPLAPQSYQGEWISFEDTRKYFQALPGSRWMVVTIGSRQPRVAITRPSLLAPRSFRRYRPAPTDKDGWTFKRWATKGINVRAGRHEWITYRGKRIELVEIADPSSAYNHDWLDVNAPGITWTGER